MAFEYAVASHIPIDTSEIMKVVTAAGLTTECATATVDPKIFDQTESLCFVSVNEHAFKIIIGCPAIQKFELILEATTQLAAQEAKLSITKTDANLNDTAVQSEHINAATQQAQPPTSDIHEHNTLTSTQHSDNETNSDNNFENVASTFANGSHARSPKVRTNQQSQTSRKVKRRDRKVKFKPPKPSDTSPDSNSHNTFEPSTE